MCPGRDPFDWQASAQSTEPHQPGLFFFIFNASFRDLWKESSYVLFYVLIVKDFSDYRKIRNCVEQSRKQMIWIRKQGPTNFQKDYLYFLPIQGTPWWKAVKGLSVECRKDLEVLVRVGLLVTALLYKPLTVFLGSQYIVFKSKRKQNSFLLASELASKNRESQQ